MKFDFTFAELSKAFSMISKIDILVKNQKEAEKEYECADRNFDAEFEKFGYTFFGAPQELHDLFDKKIELLNKREKAEKKIYKAIKEFAEILGVGSGSSNWEEETIKNFIRNKYYFDAEKIAKGCKYLAKLATNRLVF